MTTPQYKKTGTAFPRFQLTDGCSQRIKERITELAQYTDHKFQGYTRLAFSKEDKQAREFITKLMKGAGLEVRVDPAGNIIGKAHGDRSDSPVIMTGSHIDTVKEGGRFDGVAGVITTIEVIRYLKASKLRTKHPIEVVVFTSEEPNEFGISTVGSRAMAGTLDKRLLSTLKNKNELTLGQAIEFIGGNAETIDQAARKRADILAYIELHIEQGNILEDIGFHVGVVTGIAGIYRGQVTISGCADHAGTTPMNARKDALVAAAEAVMSLERIARRKYLRDTVATIGIVENFPNAANIVPGKVIMQTDIRSTKLKHLDFIEQAFQEKLQEISMRRAVSISFTRLAAVPLVAMDNWVTRLIADSCRDSRIPYHPMTSGAGHDASHMSQITRAGMIFVPSKAGKSHCPEEWTDYEDIALGTQVLLGAIMKIDERAKEIYSNE
jgi:N-carbamoyl-L-amino-acid hydrolase